MTEDQNRVWGIYGGRTGDADTLFLRQARIALGWSTLSSLANLPPDREAFKQAVAAAYPNKKPGAIPNNAGQLLRFVHEMRAGDLIVYPSKRDRQIHIRRVERGYEYNPSTEPGYPDQRSVKWLRAFPRTRFSQGALYEIGSALNLFQIRNYADEFTNALEGHPGPQPSKNDETVAVVAEDIEETTRDFVLKQLATELKGHPLAAFVADLLNAMGYHTRLSPEGPKSGGHYRSAINELAVVPVLNN
jgi:restriction system protein